MITPTCNNCKFRSPYYEEPCKDCYNNSNWEPDRGPDRTECIGYDESFCEAKDCSECEAFEEVNHNYTIAVFCPERMDPYVHTEVIHYLVDITSRMLIIVCKGKSYQYNMDRVWKFAVYEEDD